MIKKITKSEKETQELGFEFAKQIKTPDIICLYGELGSGKTSFIKGIALGLGIKDRIISPTFILIREHNFNNKNMLYHIDLYRLEDDLSMEKFGMDEIFNDEFGICAIEWAERLGKNLPKKRWDIHFSQLDENRRSIIIERIEINHDQR